MNHAKATGSDGGGTRPFALRRKAVVRGLSILGAGGAAEIGLTNHPKKAWKLVVKACPGLDAGRNERFGAFLREAGLVEAVPTLSGIALALPR